MWLCGSGMEKEQLRKEECALIMGWCPWARIGWSWRWRGSAGSWSAWRTHFGGFLVARSSETDAVHWSCHIGAHVFDG
jgi:hypothetical protein